MRLCILPNYFILLNIAQWLYWFFHLKRNNQVWCGNTHLQSQHLGNRGRRMAQLRPAQALSQNNRPRCVTQGCHLSPWELEAGEWRLGGQPRLHAPSQNVKWSKNHTLGQFFLSKAQLRWLGNFSEAPFWPPTTDRELSSSSGFHALKETLCELGAAILNGPETWVQA